MENLFGGIYKNKTVLVTGHTGFKGSWLCFWLKQMQANIIGYSLAAPTTPNHFSLLDLDITSIIADIREQEKLDEVFQIYKPDIVFHLAAQPLVRLSYELPVETFEINVMGTIKVFEACRKALSVKAIVNITSDKCYANHEWVWGYRENDPMGGYDPYSASKGCAELLSESYKNSFFNIQHYKKTHHTLLASCRAGNVIGGGDWAQDRLICDIMIAASKGTKTSIRNPNAIRPWQHVLEALSGYLLIGQKLMEGNKEAACGWNFGPSNIQSYSVLDAVLALKKSWSKIKYETISSSNNLHETNYLKLDCSKAYTELKWREIWDSHEAFEKTAIWYKTYYEENKVLSKEHLQSFIISAKAKNIEWAIT